jgi:hypothetical protein
VADIGYKLEIGKYMLYGKSLDCKHGSLQTEQESFSVLLLDKKAFAWKEWILVKLPGLHVCYNQEILVNNAADHKQICVIYETVYFCIWGRGVWSNLVYPPGLKIMNFSLTVIGLHVCYNQEMLVNIAADHRQICVIYKRLFIFALGGGVWCNLLYPPETFVWLIPLYPYFPVAHPRREIFFRWTCPSSPP